MPPPAVRGLMGPRGWHRGRGRRPAQNRQPRGRPNDRMPQPALRQPNLDARSLPGLMQPTMQVDGMQRLAIMLVMMILGAPQIYGCHTKGASGIPGALSLPYLDACPGVTSSEMIEMGPRRRSWTRMAG